MEAIDLHAEAWEGIRKGCESGRLAHAYVIIGSPRGQGLQFATSFLKLLFCRAADKPCNECIGCQQLESHQHVDTLWIEPQSKSRKILTEDVRGLIRRMSQTAFDGGWKAGVILSAECMNVNSANALLKTLEEPPPKSLLLLVTDSPQSLLPTILSRCQKIVLSSGRFGAMDAEWRGPLQKILRDLPPSGGLDAARLASQLKGLFDTVKTGIAAEVEDDLGLSEEALDESKLKDILAARTNARLKEVQADVFRVMLDWHRDVLMLVNGIDEKHLVFPDARDILLEQSKSHTPGTALKAVQVVERMAGRLERNIPDLQIFDEAFRRLVRSSV
jgi:DNA polymerase-3 subunit delta'